MMLDLVSRLSLRGPVYLLDCGNRSNMYRVARTLRADYGLAPSQKVDYILRPARESDAERLLEDQASIASLLRANEIRVEAGFEPPGAMPSGLSQLGTVYMPLAGLVDVPAEIARLSGQLDKVEGDLNGVTRKLDNISFVSKAPAHVVDLQKTRKKELLEKREKLQQLIETLSEGNER